MQTDQPDKDSRKEVLDLLKDIQSHYATYHNHKEAMGWAGVVFYAALAMGTANATQNHQSHDDFYTTILTIGIIVIGAICWVYVRQQFANRKRGGELVAACVWLRAKLVADPSASVDLRKWQPPSQSSSAVPSALILPEIISKVADELAPKSGRPTRKVLETCAFLLLLSIMLVLLGLMWGKGFVSLLALGIPVLLIAFLWTSASPKEPDH